MTKIVLIYPKFPIALSLNIPIGLLHLGTYLKKHGFAVKLIDCTIEDEYEKLIAQEIEGAACIGISLMTAQIPHAQELGIFIRQKIKSRIPIVLGGVHPTLYPQETIREDFVDYAVVGEGEVTLLNLLQALANPKKQDISAIPGLVYLDTKNTPRVNLQGEVFDFTQMPAYDYQLLNPKVLDAYRREEIYFPLLTSRGCPYRCAFCINVVTKNVKWRSFNAQRTVAEIERVIQMGFKRIWFWDENFFVHKQRTEEILSLLEAKDIYFEAYSAGRADYIRPNYLNQGLLSRLEKRGFNRLGFGFESGAQKILDYLRKDITVEQILNACQECERAGIRVSASFMIGVPEETSADIKKTVEVIAKISVICSRLGINGPQFYRPYPGSKLYDDCLKAGWQEPQGFQEWSLRIKRDFYDTPNPYQAPWIKDPALVNLVYFYAYTLSVSAKKLLTMFKEFCSMTRKKQYFFWAGAAGLTLLAFLGKLRYKTGFHRFLWEKKIFYKYHPNLDY